MSDEEKEPEIRKIDYIMFENEKWEKLKKEKEITQEFIKQIIIKENELVDRINQIERGENNG